MQEIAFNIGIFLFGAAAATIFWWPTVNRLEEDVAYLEDGADCDGNTIYELRAELATLKAKQPVHGARGRFVSKAA